MTVDYIFQCSFQIQYITHAKTTRSTVWRTTALCILPSKHHNLVLTPFICDGFWVRPTLQLMITIVLCVIISSFLCYNHSLWKHRNTAVILQLNIMRQSMNSSSLDLSALHGRKLESLAKKVLYTNDPDLKRRGPVTAVRQTAAPLSYIFPFEIRRGLASECTSRLWLSH